MYVLNSLQGSVFLCIVHRSLRVLILKVIFLLAVTLTRQVAELHGLLADFLISLFQETSETRLLELL